MTSLAAKLQPMTSHNHPSGGTITEISKNRKSYTLDFKRQVINFYHAHAGNISLAAKMFGVDRKMVRNWVENEDFFRRQTEDGHQLQEPMAPIAAPSQPNKAPTAQRKRLERNFASGSAARYPELERSLAEWWTVQLSQGQNIKAKALKTQALLLFHNLYPSSSDQDFKASTGWLQRFVARMEAGGTNPATENQNDNNAQQFPGRSSLNGNRSRVNMASSLDQGDNAAAMNPLIYWAAQQQGNIGMLFNQNHAQNSVTASSKAPGSKKRTPSDLVPIYPKPSQPTSSSSNLAACSSSYPSPSFDGGLKRNRSIYEAPVEVEEPPTVKYVPMSQQDRAVMEQQKQEVDKFFQDCRDFLNYLDKLH